MHAMTLLGDPDVRHAHRGRTVVAYVGTRVGAPLLGGQDPVSVKRLEVLWAGSTLAMADQFQDGELRELQITLRNPCVILNEDRAERFGTMPHARIVDQIHESTRRGEADWDGVVFVDTVDGMEVADVYAVFPQPGVSPPTVSHAVQVVGSKWFDPALDDWRSTPGFGEAAMLGVPSMDRSLFGGQDGCATALAACPMLSCWFNGSVVRVADPTNLAGVAYVEGQYPEGHPGQAIAKDLLWFDVQAYPIERLCDAATVEWFDTERAMWAAEGEVDRFDDRVGEPIATPIVVHEGAHGAYTWDGNQRVGASLADGKFSIPALVGFRPDALAESMAQWTAQLNRVEAAQRARSVALGSASPEKRRGLFP